jgi:hypothetical protein
VPRAWLLVLVALIAVALAVLAAVQDDHRAHAPVLPLTFDHADHRDVNCIECHHDYAEDKPLMLCLACHKQDSQVAHLVEQQFHDFCRGCHVEDARTGEPHGPTRHCGACHPVTDAARAPMYGRKPGAEASNTVWTVTASTWVAPSSRARKPTQPFTPPGS